MKTAPAEELATLHRWLEDARPRYRALVAPDTDRTPRSESWNLSDRHISIQTTPTAGGAVFEVSLWTSLKRRLDATTTTEPDEALDLVEQFARRAI